MSNYCQSCVFKPTEKSVNTHAHLITFIGHFLVQHRSRLSNNPRMAMMYRTYDKMDAQLQETIQNLAHQFIQDL